MLFTLAGMFTRSNAGHEISLEIARRARRDPPHNALSAAELFCPDLMLTCEHKRLLAKEAAFWTAELRKIEEDEARRRWPHIFKVYDQAAPPAGAEIPVLTSWLRAGDVVKLQRSGIAKRLRANPQTQTREKKWMTPTRRLVFADDTLVIWNRDSVVWKIAA